MSSNCLETRKMNNKLEPTKPINSALSRTITHQRTKIFNPHTNISNQPEQFPNSNNTDMNRTHTPIWVNTQISSFITLQRWSFYFFILRECYWVLVGKLCLYIYGWDPSKLAWLGVDESLIGEMILMLVNEF